LQQFQARRLTADLRRVLEPVNFHEFNTEPVEVVCPTVCVVGGGPSPPPAIQKKNRAQPALNKGPNPPFANHAGARSVIKPAHAALAFFS
jgi:hypothetical protein